MKTSKWLPLVGMVCLAPMMVLAANESTTVKASPHTMGLLNGPTGGSGYTIVHLTKVSSGGEGSIKTAVDGKGNVSITDGKTTMPVYDKSGNAVRCTNYLFGAPDCGGSSGSFKLTSKEKAVAAALKKAESTVSSKVNDTTTVLAQQPIFGTQINN